MDNLNTIYESLLTQEQDLRKLIHKLQDRQKNRIPGSLIVSGSKQKSFYFKSPFDEPLVYLSKSSDINQIKRLAQQEYEEKLLTAAEMQLAAVQKAAGLLCGKELERTYSRTAPSKQELIKPLFPDRERFIRDWTAVSYTPGHFDPNTPECYSERGERVRSKSEKIIADKYLHLEVLYRYEYPIVLNDNGKRAVFRPDFTLLNKRTCKTIYHQHLGKMSDPGYVADNLHKLKVFEENGIHLGKNLFFTFETREEPFDDRTLDPLIQRYLL